MWPNLQFTQDQKQALLSVLTAVAKTIGRMQLEALPNWTTTADPSQQIDTGAGIRQDGPR